MNTGFLKQQAALFEGLFALAELLTVLACFFIVHRITEGDFSLLVESLLIVQATLIATYGVFRVGGLYRSARGRSILEELGRLFICWLAIVLMVGLFAFLTKTGEVVSRIWFGFSMLMGFLLLATLRTAVRYVLSNLRSRGLNWRTILIVGTGELAYQTISTLEANKWVGMKVVALFGDEENQSTSTSLPMPIEGRVTDVFQFVEQRRKQGQPIDQVWITLPLREEQKTRKVVRELRDSSVDICLVPDLFGASLLRGAVDEIGGIPLISLSNVRISSLGDGAKKLLDLIASLLGIVVLSPFWLIVSIMIKIDSPGPVFFKQRRYGVNGKEIVVWKLRTMTSSEDGEVVVQATSDDRRVTRLGGVLRRLSLDELPQLFNVLGGSMSLVGPRPHAVAHNEEYRQKISGYMMRHKIKPGITGWAQVNGWRGETDTLEKMEKRVEFDLEYMKNWSIWFDLKILCLTLVRGFGGKDVY